MNEKTHSIRLPRFLFWFAWLGVLCWPLGSGAQTKRALVMGIGEYRDAEWPVIHGDKDVPLVKQILKGLGYQEIRSLVNGQATKKRMVGELQRLARRCRLGDVVYIHFSGHGQRVTDVDGDEPDGWDEAWVPYDASLHYGPDDRGELHLLDDELGELLTDIRNKVGTEGRILVVADACHSGDSSRELGEEGVRGVEQPFVLPAKAVAPSRKRLSEYWLTLSACESYQSNSELPDGHGKLSYCLFENREQLATWSNAQLLEQLTSFMEEHRRGLPQTPVLSGQTDRPVSVLFGGRP